MRGPRRDPRPEKHWRDRVRETAKENPGAVVRQNGHLCIDLTDEPSHYVRITGERKFSDETRNWWYDLRLVYTALGAKANLEREKPELDWEEHLAIGGFERTEFYMFDSFEDAEERLRTLLPDYDDREVLSVPDDQ